MQEFILGTNYWASHAGVDMWRNWQEEAVRTDLKILRDNGVRYLRVFPNWRDFQPVKPLFSDAHSLREYRMEPNDTYPENPYFLDPVMLNHFHTFCRLAAEADMQLIVGLITGWMSGRLFLPTALYGKNLYTDVTAQYFEQLFVKGFVTSMKEEKSIYAWDLGNECNCMDEAANRIETYSWTSMIANAIRACDSSRQIVSGMHSLTLSGAWNIQDQAELTDILTTHPYPLWVEHCQKTPIIDYRTLLHATAQTQYYATVGQKPCLVEEIGTMGPMICNEENAAGFMKVNLWSNWANGAIGLMWWCANEQSHLTATPYEWNMFERELGMLDRNRQPKPMLLEMKKFGEELAALRLDLPKRTSDGVCILSQGQDHWGVAYMTYLLGKQAGLTLDFAYCDQELPDSKLYFLPSVCWGVMNKTSYEALKEKAAQGATLYISMNNGFMTEFEEVTGLRVMTSHQVYEEGKAQFAGFEIPYSRPYQLDLTPVRAKVLAEDEQGRPLFCEASYGKGKIYFLNFPMEEMLLNMEKGLEQPYYQYYKAAAQKVIDGQIITRKNPNVGYTLHKDTDTKAITKAVTNTDTNTDANTDTNTIYAVLVNYTAQHQRPEITWKKGCKAELLYGHDTVLEPFGTAIFKIQKSSPQND